MSGKPEGSTGRIYLLLVLTTVFWGSAFTASKVAVASVSPTVAAFFRFGLGALFMLLILRLGKRETRNIPKQFRGSVILLGVTGVALYNLFFFWALHFSKASDGSMIIPTMSPVITVLLAALWWKEKLQRSRLVGLAVALAGTLLFFSGILMGDGVGGGERLIGGLFFLLSAICWAFYTLYGNRVLKELDPFPVTAYAMLTGAVLLGLFAAFDLMRVSWSSLEPGFWINQFYLALFPSVLANWFYYRGVQSVGASRAAMFMYIVPVSGVLLAVALLGERLTLVQMFGSLLMVLGIWLVNRRGESSPAGKLANRSVPE